MRGAFHARFSPDGKWLAYSTDAAVNLLQESQVFVIPAGGGTPRRIGSDVAWAGIPVWSGDSRFVFFTGANAIGDHESLALWRAPAAGGPSFRLSVPEFGRNGVSDVQDWQGDRILTSRGGRLIAMDPVRPAPSETLFSATGFISGARAAAGRIVFGLIPPLTSRLWTVPFDYRTGKVLGALQPLLQSGGSQQMPASSFDGSKLLYSHIDPTRSELRLRDMANGKEPVLPSPSVRGKISPDGSKVAFGDRKSISLIDSAGGETIKLIDGERSALCGWAGDGQSFVYYLNGPIRWFTYHLNSRKSTPIFPDSERVIHGVEFSPDNRWVSFHIPGGIREPLYISPASNGAAAGESEWIRIAELPGRNGRPWWAPDGNLLYWVSELDGFACVWAQRLDSATKRPNGEPFSLLHFHESSHTLAEYGLASVGPAISKDRLTFALPERSGNIWIAEPDKSN